MMMQGPGATRSRTRAARCAAIACGLVLLGATGGSLAHAQTGEPADGAAPRGFEDFEACKAFSQELATITEDSKRLEQAMASKATSQNELLAAIFEGTQIMLAYGERMFEASDKYEEKCKAALREAEQAALIVEIYDRVLEPTMRGYDFLVRVRDSAEALGEEQTVADMSEAIEGYKASAHKLVEFCESDLPEDVAEARCGEFSRRLDARMR